jgi:hypothetical protein
MSFHNDLEKPNVSRLEGQVMPSANDDRVSLEKGHDAVNTTWTAEEERSALRKLDWNLIPL